MIQFKPPKKNIYGLDMDNPLFCQFAEEHYAVLKNQRYAFQLINCFEYENFKKFINRDEIITEFTETYAIVKRKKENLFLLYKTIKRLAKTDEKTNKEYQKIPKSFSKFEKFLEKNFLAFDAYIHTLNLIKLDNFSLS
jgi:hypothetical protein